MRRRPAMCESFAFTADRFGRPIQARITTEALAQFTSSKMLRLQPRQVRRIFMEHHAEINRIARIIGEERNDLAGQLLITGSDILRLRQR
jgi:Protein of unknown function (DUF1488)